MTQQDEALALDGELDNYEYPITIEDIGPSAKRVSVDVPEERIASMMNEQLQELQSVAAIPGFRVGKAPRKVIEKRFASELRRQVRDSIIRGAYQQAITKHSLAVLGEPEFDDEKSLEKLPESGPLKFSFSVEVQPEFTVPDLSDLTVKKPVIEVNDSHVEQALQNLRDQQGTLVPVDGRGIQAKDYVIADVHIKFEGEVVGHQHDAQIVVRPGTIGGIEIKDLDVQLAGLKPDDVKTVTAKAPDTHPAEKIRGKDVEVEFKIKDIKYLEPAEITDEFLAYLGFENKQELLDELRKQMIEKIDQDVRTAMHNQIRKAILDRVQIELPAKLSQRQADRVVSRRVTDLIMRGVSEQQLRANVERIKAGAADQAKAELKLFFVLNKIAQDNGIEVDEAEVNGHIAQMAIMTDRRPEKLKQELASRGQLQDLFLFLREKKTLDKILEGVKIEEVKIEGQDAKSVDPAAKDLHEDESPASDE